MSIISITVDTHRDSRTTTSIFDSNRNDLKIKSNSFSILRLINISVCHQSSTLTVILFKNLIVAHLLNKFSFY